MGTRMSEWCRRGCMVKIGVLHHDTPMWSGFQRESGIDVNLEAIFSPQIGVLGGVIRPAFGGSVNTAGDTSKLYTATVTNTNT